MGALKNIFYFYSLNDIGGVETFLYYLSKKYSDYDITVYYSDSNSSISQINRLKKYVRVKKYNGEQINCDTAFWNYKPLIIDKVNAKEHIQVIHANYLKQPNLWKPNQKITKYVAVSKDCANAFTELTGIDCEYAYIPIEYDFKRQRLLITAAQRMDTMKGVERIKRLDQELSKQNIPHLILVFTNKVDNYVSNNVIYVSSRLDIANYIKGSDYFFCGSDYEAYGLSPVEALCLGVPVIRTPLKVFEELGMNDSNSIVLNFDCSNIEEVINKMINIKFNFKYTPKKDTWDKYLAKGESTYQKDLNTIVNVKCIERKGYYDLEKNNEFIKYEQEFPINKARADHLVELGLVEIIKKTP